MQEFVLPHIVRAQSSYDQDTQALQRIRQQMTQIVLDQEEKVKNNTQAALPETCIAINNHREKLNQAQLNLICAQDANERLGAVTELLATLDKQDKSVNAKIEHLDKSQEGAIPKMHRTLNQIQATSKRNAQDRTREDGELQMRQQTLVTQMHDQDSINWVRRYREDQRAILRKKLLRQQAELRGAQPTEEDIGHLQSEVDRLEKEMDELNRNGRTKQVSHRNSQAPQTPRQEH